jgi:Cu/Ag efflux protein CusF
MSDHPFPDTFAHTGHRPTPALRAVLLALGLLGAATAFAGDDHDHGEAQDGHAASTQVATPVAPAAAPAQAATAASAAELSEGEVVRWDARTSKVTLRHGPIANLGMPPMSMVFKVQNAEQGSALQTGMKVRFRAEQQQGTYVLTHIAPAP